MRLPRMAEVGAIHLLAMSLVQNNETIPRKRRDDIRRMLQSWPFNIKEPGEELLHLSSIALTHDSYVNEQRDRSGEAMADNERLEFLGDAVLELAVRDHLFINTLCKEGELTIRLQALTSNSSLATRLRGSGLDLEPLLLTGEGLRQLSDRMLTGAFEALLGAIYLIEELESAREAVLRLISTA